MTDEKILNKVRGLLEKAASTNFDEESKTYYAKAEELMEKYLIDESMLARAAGINLKPVKLTIEVQQRTLISEAARQLLNGIAINNRCRCVWGRTRYVKGQANMDKLWIYGMPSDTQFVELLYTTLLSQMVSSCEKVAPTGPRVQVFRKNFYMHFVPAVVNTLTINRLVREQNIRETKQAGALVVLEDVEAQVEVFVADQHGVLGHAPRGGGHSYDHAGATAGREAGKNADISGGRNHIAR